MNRSHRCRAVYSAERRASLVREFRSSRETQKQFARRHGIRWATFRNWLYGRKPLAAGAAGAQVEFQEVQIAPLLAARSWAAEVSLPNGTVVRLQAGTDPAWIQAILQPLRQSC